MAHIVVFVLAVLSGVASFYELTEFNKTASEGKVPPIAAGVAGFILGLLVAFIAPALVIGVLVGVACFHEVRVFENQTKDRLLGMQTIVWAAVAGAMAFVGGSIAPVFTWFVICVFAAFAGAFWLLYQEKERLAAENKTWIAENQRLLLERGARGLSATHAPSAPPAAAPVAPAPPAAGWAPAPTPAPAPAPAPLPLRSGAVRKPPTWGTSQRPGTASPQPYAPRPPSGGDFLPRR
jgi:hypothetical protein